MAHNDPDPLTPPYLLEGATLPSGWVVGKRLKKQDGDTGGHFSVGYECASSDGMHAFVKAIDLYEPLQKSTNLLTDLAVWMAEVNGERDLLHDCERMDRVIDVLDEGVLRELHGNPLHIPVPYIVFERAEGTARRAVGARNLAHSWSLRVLQQAAVGLKQMHAERIAHQDLKLSNILLFAENKGAKLSDLGRAVKQGQAVPHAALPWPGDWGYAPPEFAYSYEHPEFAVRRLAADLYLLGNCISTILIGIPVTTLLFDELPSDFRPPRFNGTFAGTFQDALPYLHEAQQRVLDRIAAAIQPPTPCTDDIVRIIRELCHPEPAARGHPRTHALHKSGDSAFQLERYLSELDLLSRRAALHEAASRPK